MHLEQFTLVSISLVKFCLTSFPFLPTVLEYGMGTLMLWMRFQDRQHASGIKSVAVFVWGGFPQSRMIVLGIVNYLSAPIAVIKHHAQKHMTGKCSISAQFLCRKPALIFMKYVNIDT